MGDHTQDLVERLRASMEKYKQRMEDKKMGSAALPAQIENESDESESEEEEEAENFTTRYDGKGNGAGEGLNEPTYSLMNQGSFRPEQAIERSVLPLSTQMENRSFIQTTAFPLTSLYSAYSNPTIGEEKGPSFQQSQHRNAFSHLMNVLDIHSRGKSPLSSTSGFQNNPQAAHFSRNANHANGSESMHLLNHQFSSINKSLPIPIQLNDGTPSFPKSVGESEDRETEVVSQSIQEEELTTTRPKKTSKKRQRATVQEKEHDTVLLEKIRKKGKEPLRFECTFPGCDKMFAWKWTMEKHRKTHLGDAGRTHVCKVCERGFFTKGCLSAHMNIHTRQPGSHKCTYEGCSKSYLTQEGLTLHIRNHHTTEKHCACPQEGCDKTFVRQADLRLHVIRVHCKDKPFPCQVAKCTKAFACLSELKRHLKSHRKNPAALAALETINSPRKTVAN